MKALQPQYIAHLMTLGTNGLTLSLAVNPNGREPKIPDKVAFSFAVRNVPPCVVINVRFRKTKINHIDRLLIGWKTDNAVSQLDVSVKNPAHVHELESCNLPRCRSSASLGNFDIPDVQRKQSSSPLEWLCNRRFAGPSSPSRSRDTDCPNSDRVDR